jgi:hypothetical protein
MPRDRPPAPGDAVARVRALCTAYPGTQERLSHGEPAWFAGGTRLFVSYADHHHDDRVAIWAAAPPGAQEALVAGDGQRYFRPPYVGHRGWVGVFLDVTDIDWDRVALVVDDAWRCVAPSRLLAEHDGR